MRLVGNWLFIKTLSVAAQPLEGEVYSRWVANLIEEKTFLIPEQNSKILWESFQSGGNA